RRAGRVRARQRRGLRHGARAKAVRGVPAPARRGGIFRHRHRPRDCAPRGRAPRRARLGRGDARRRRDVLHRVSGGRMKRDSAVRLRVLLLEDNSPDAELVLYELQRTGIEAETVRVITREDFEQQLEARPDAILSDYQLPLWNGLDALMLVRAHGLDTPFIIVSGMIGEDLAVEAMRHGADDYLLKDRLSRLGV